MKNLLLFVAIALSINVFGQSTVKIGNLEVMTEDLEGKMTWEDAMKACADLGDGWRLPTKDELNTLYQNKDKIGGFADYGYWSSTEYGNLNCVAQISHMVPVLRHKGNSYYVSVLFGLFNNLPIHLFNNFINTAKRSFLVM